MRVLTNIDPSSLKSTMSHLRVQGEVSEPRVFGKTTIMVQHEVLEVVPKSYCAWSRSNKVSSTSGEQSVKGTGDVGG